MYPKKSQAVRTPQTCGTRKYDAFTFKDIVSNGLLIAVLFLLNKLGTPGSAVCYAVLFIMAIRSSAGAIKALSLSALIIVANAYLIDINLIHTYLRFPLIAVGGFRIFYDASHRRQRFSLGPHVVALLGFGIVSLMLAFINQYFFMISFLKLGVFIYGAIAILLASDSRSYVSASKLTAWFCALVLFFIVGNALAYVLGVGYTFRGKLYEVGENLTLGYAGMTNHPQTLGSLATISFVYAFCVFLLTPYRLRWIMGLAAPLLLVLCYLSASRTGFFAALISVFTIVGIAILTRMGSKRVRMNISMAQIIAIAVFGLLSLITFETITNGIITQKLSDFALKVIRGDSRGGFSFARIFESRERLIEISWYNFMQKPFTGIGFGTMWDAQWAAQANIFTAPTEKGFLPTALLEEVGIPGAMCFVVFLVTYFWHYWKIRNIAALSMMVCLLLLNFGEMMFFAFGGIGLYCWAFIGAGISVGNPSLTKERG